MRDSSHFFGTQKMLDNKDKGLCWCGSRPNKPLRAYCSIRHKKHFGNLWVDWATLRERIIKKHGKYCDFCKTEDGIFEVDHKVAIVNGGSVWKRSNLQVLCKVCHSKKTGKDVKLKNIKAVQSLHNIAVFGGEKD